MGYRIPHIWIYIIPTNLVNIQEMRYRTITNLKNVLSFHAKIMIYIYHTLIISYVVIEFKRYYKLI